MKYVSWEESKNINKQKAPELQSSKFRWWVRPILRFLPYVQKCRWFNIVYNGYNRGKWAFFLYVNHIHWTRIKILKITQILMDLTYSAWVMILIWPGVVWTCLLIMCGHFVIMLWMFHVSSNIVLVCLEVSFVACETVVLFSILIK